MSKTFLIRYVLSSQPSIPHNSCCSTLRLIESVALSEHIIYMDIGLLLSTRRRSLLASSAAMSGSLYVATAGSCAINCCNDAPSPFTIPAPASPHGMRRPRPPLRAISSEISALFGSNGYASSGDTSRKSSADMMQAIIATCKESQARVQPSSCLSDSVPVMMTSKPQRSDCGEESMSKGKREDSGVLIEDELPQRPSTPIEYSTSSHDFAYNETDAENIELQPNLKGRLDPLALTEAINLLTLGDPGLRQEELDSKQLHDRTQEWTSDSRVEPGVVVCDGVHWIPKDHRHCQRPEWDRSACSRKCSLAYGRSTLTSAWKVTTTGIIPVQSCPSLSDASGSPDPLDRPSPSQSDDNISITAIAPFSRRASRRNSDTSGLSINLTSAFPSTTAFNNSITSPSSLPDLCPDYCDAIVDWAAAAHDMQDATGEYALARSQERANEASSAMKRSLDAAFAKEVGCKRRKIRRERRRLSATTTGYPSSACVSVDEMMLDEVLDQSVEEEEGEMRRGDRVGSVDDEWLQPERTEYFVLT